METRINQDIQCTEVRLINEEGNQLGVYPLHLAILKAKEEDLDLVEVSPNTSPPVCRLMDFGKFKFEQKKKEKEKRRKRTEVKTIKLRPKIGEADLMTKINQISKFLMSGFKVHIVVLFKGREITHKDLGATLLERVFSSINGHGSMEVPPKMEGRTMMMILTPS